MRTWIVCLLLGGVVALAYFAVMYGVLEWRYCEKPLGFNPFGPPVGYCAPK